MAPRKLTPELTHELCASRRAGYSHIACATRSGVGTSTLHNWLAKGANGSDTAYAAFYNAFGQAYQEFLREQIRSIAHSGAYSSRQKVNV